MKLAALLLGLVVVSLGVFAQTENSIEVGDLVKIVQTSDFKGMTKLVENLDYIVLDSSKLSDGNLSYITKEVKINGNTLGCMINKAMKIEMLTFTTSDKQLYYDLKKQIVNAGFKSSGKSTGGLPEIQESEDFEKGQIIVSTSTQRKDTSLRYELNIMKW